MKETQFEILIIAGVLILVSIGILILTQFMYDATFKPKMVSLNSINKMSCDELETNYQVCRKDMHTSDWDYCNTLFLPKYYGKCVVEING